MLNNKSSQTSGVNCRQSGKIKLALLALVGLWLMLLASDWALRFIWFKWHTRLMIAKVAPGNVEAALRGPDSPLKQIETAAGSGGNLSNLIPAPEIARQFAQSRPAAMWLTDEYGFLNHPPVAGKEFPVVVVGDSFMTARTSMSNSFPAQLEQALGVLVYNYGFAGRGPTFALRQFLEDERFLRLPPGVLVWGLTEQYLSGRKMWPDIASLLVVDEGKALGSGPSEGSINWSRLRPSRLSDELTRSSAMAQLARNVRDFIVFHVFDLLPEDLVPSLDGGMLFNRWNLLELRVPWEARQPDVIRRVVSGIKEILEHRGIRLLVVLIPEKEHVYKDLVPERSMSRGYWLEAQATRRHIKALLEELGIDYLDVLPPLQEATKLGRPVYWADDTHWSPEGIAIAVDAAANEPIFRGPESSLKMRVTP